MSTIYRDVGMSHGRIRPPGQILVVPTRRARVYKFGSIYHWKCGAFTNSTPATCVGGRARTIEHATYAAHAHISEHHLELYRLVVSVDGCRICGWPEDRHDLAVRLGQTGSCGCYRTPTKKQRRYRVEQGERIKR